MNTTIETIHGEYPPVICDLCIGHGDILMAEGSLFTINNIGAPTHGYGGCTVYRIYGYWNGKIPEQEELERSPPCVEFWLHGGLGYFYTNKINLIRKISDSNIPIGRPLEVSGHPKISQSIHV
jgi:hypothetical protein